MALEIVEMHGKLRDSNPGAKLPNLPIDVSALPPPPPKRKSAFLNTLSRLASPSSSKSSLRQASFTRLSTATSISSTASPTLTNGTAASTATTPVASPSQEINDPFNSISDVSTTANGSLAASQSSLPPTNSIAASLAAYLTTIANDPSIRQTRVWKRFVRVRTDDLQSVRVERAIKRVRSDLAAHSGSSSTPEVKSMAQVLGEDAEQRSVNVSIGGSATEVSSLNGTIDAVEDLVNGTTIDGSMDDVKEEKANVDDDDDEIVENVTVPAVEDIATETEQDRAPTPQIPKTPIAPVSSAPTPIDTSVVSHKVNLEEDVNGPSTPVPGSAASQSRITRSQSADPSARKSRILYSPSSPLRESQLDGTASSATSFTGDDSSISTTGRRRRTRKKRSKSTDPNASSSKTKLSQRKAVIDDFEMMRVLGKGCAGKVLLVRHKPTLDVFALKAITKRHVLAHQELQHTLTEQAVLKRMAAEGSDPFVVKSWWSFHDKENLFLVMVSCPSLSMLAWDLVCVICDRISIPEEILLPNSLAGAVSVVIVHASTQQKLSKVSKASMPPVSSTAISSLKTSSLAQTDILSSQTLVCPKNSREGRMRSLHLPLHPASEQSSWNRMEMVGVEVRRRHRLLEPLS